MATTVLVNIGKQWIVDKLDDTVVTLAKWVGWGTGAGVSDPTDVALFTEDSGGAPAYARIEGVITQPAGDTMRVVATLTANGAKTITNAGNFTAVSGANTLVVKGDFDGIVLAEDDQIQFTIDLQIT
jgi:hypothetical protein